MTSVFLAQLCLTHGKHLGNYETLSSLLEISTLSLSLHPKNEELTHLQYHDTEIIPEKHHHFSEDVSKQQMSYSENWKEQVLLPHLDGFCVLNALPHTLP